MDPVSITASIGALLTIAVKVMQATHSYGVAVKEFPRELQDLMAELQALSGILTNLSVVYGPSSSGSLPVPTSIVDPFGGALDGCTKCLKSAYESLQSQNSGNKMRRVFKRITWPLNEGETKELFSRLGRYKSTFSLAISSYDTTLRRATYDGIKELKDHEIQKSAKKELEKKSERLRSILRWLSVADPEVNHIAGREIREEGTGGWFVDGKVFEDWLLADSSFLWLYGKPGAGKTVLSSMAIDRAMLEVTANTDPNATQTLVYFYCDFKDSLKQSADNLLASLMAQLIRGKAEIPDSLDELYRNKFDDGRVPPQAGHLEEVLNSITKGFTKVVAIIDALDECTIEGRARLCKRLKTLTKHGNMNLLIISRDEPDIREEFANLPSLMIRDEDVSADIERYVLAEMGRQARLNRLKPSTKSSIVSTLVGEANGMFRWASCCLEEVSRLRTDKAIRAALKSLPPTLEQSYERILSNIDERDKVIAIRVFQWLLFAHRPMGLREITEAIAVEIGDTSMDSEGRLNDPEEIPQICGALVRLDQRNMKLGLAHFTVKEYLLSEKIARGPAAPYRIQKSIANTELIKTCLTYILFDDFASGHCRTEEKYKARIQDYPLLIYAAKEWTIHMEEYKTGSDKVLDELVLSFFYLNPDHGKFYAWMQANMSLETKTECFTKKRTYPVLAPIHLAVNMGHIQAVEELINRGIDINMRSEQILKAGTPLESAVSDQNLDLVRLLLEKGADPNLQIYSSMEPLKIAAGNDSTEIMRMLLKHGAEAYEEGERYLGALFETIRLGNEAAMEVLLETDEYKKMISTIANAEDIITPPFIILVHSIVKGLEKIFRKVWDTDWGVDVIIERGFLVLMLVLSATHGHSRFVRIILQDKKARGAAKKDEIFYPVLHETAYMGNQVILDLLLDLREDIQANEMGIALNLAAMGGHADMIERLINAGADPLYAQAGGWTPLVNACEYRNENAVKALSAIEGVAESVKLSAMVGPTCWQTVHKRSGLDVSADGLEVRNSSTDTEATIEADNPVIALHLIKNYSFEVKILKTSNSGFYMCIGFAEALFYRVSIWQPEPTRAEYLFREPDCELKIAYPGRLYSGKSWGYCNDGGLGHGEDDVAAEGYEAHDIVGCHFDGTKNVAFFTRNGKLVGKIIGGINGKIVPIVTLGPGFHIRVNFGAEPLVYSTPLIPKEQLDDPWMPNRDLAPGLLPKIIPLV